MATVKATTAVPALYRILLTIFEPLAAFGGIILILTDPGYYLSGMTRENLTSYPAEYNFLLWQIAGGWTFIVFTESTTLRFVDDLRVWKFLCMGILLCDALYTHSTAMAVGGWSEWLTFGKWTGQDLIAAVMTWPFVLTRVAIVLGIGLRTPGAVKRA
ncbi:hypothetical protein CLAFUW4_12741 [Fulvia fulva]|uniref:DUF7704 domain-containing protein n=1 Tax=Passalora fulva TaxID=5499 RepID=A0A9Q8PJP6_PASFU|nr:uncharacterized protein CLAFUR5_12607 [Fulvia fulva]KAK4611736.1 hypothetical protein CLAFUR4_12745 [Fulvia fulva]KAK4612376.1 hypothetical protein CLAFUR0_12752 [Fulvia fulva]UJO23718.1 hypothetical protein CLAFUR5_12607 [Fulvia fulva]WPV21574.1 hypothetical protein CLAFUW4_12741 [Fulvia fulva]WPV36182.1 hypothetical protein CLAFUW7_12748 [Fulvia fulva]